MSNSNATVSEASQIDATKETRVSAATVILEFFYAILATTSIVLFGLSEAEMLGDEFSSLARTFDLMICVIFASQAVISLWRAPSKKRWWKWGWADFLASVPEIEVLRVFRGLRLFLVIRSIRSTVKSVRGLAQLFNAGRTQTVFALVFTLIVTSILLSSFLILGLESTHPGSNIRTAQEALLWSLATITGVEPAGFGDHYPVTGGGRVIAIWLVIVSLGLIGSLAGVISAWIEEEHQEQD